MTIHLRNLSEGDRFYLLRTMERYTLLRRDRSTPSGTRYVVLREGEERESSLHHSCYVKPVLRPVAEPCDPCRRFFARYYCSAAKRGECDCPKCQGFCKCASE